MLSIKRPLSVHLRMSTFVSFAQNTMSFQKQNSFTISELSETPYMTTVNPSAPYVKAFEPQVSYCKGSSSTRPYVLENQSSSRMNTNPSSESKTPCLQTLENKEKETERESKQDGEVKEEEEDWCVVDVERTQVDQEEAGWVSVVPQTDAVKAETIPETKEKEAKEKKQVTHGYVVSANGGVYTKSYPTSSYMVSSSSSSPYCSPR